MQSTFWINQAIWQPDTSRYTFLARAVLKVGKALYPDDWSDFDPARELPARPRPFLQSAWNVTKRYGPGEAQRRREAKERAEQAIANFSEEEFERKKKLALQSLCRFQHVMATIAGAAERDKGLATVFRRKGGFGFKTIPREWWQVSTYTPRFQLCQINTRDPGSRAISGDGSEWAHIFVSRVGLTALIDSLENPQSNTHTPDGAEQVAVPDVATAGAPKAGRPDKRPRVLQIFRDRLARGETLPVKSHESRAIVKEWTEPEPPVPSSVAGWIKEEHSKLRFLDGRVLPVGEV